MPKKKRATPRPKIAATGGPGAIPVALAFYSPEDHAWLRRHAEDRDSVDDTYEEWLSARQRLALNLQAQGVSVVDVPVLARELVPWLDERGLPNTAGSRANYAVWKAMQHPSKEGG